MGKRYGSDPRISYVQLGVGIYGETKPAEDAYTDCLKAAGLTSDKWLAFVNWSLDLYREVFPGKELLLQYPTYFESRRERKAFTDHAASLGIGLKHTCLKPDGGDYVLINDPSASLYEAGEYDPIAKWGSQVATAWEGYGYISVSLTDRTTTMWGCSTMRWTSMRITSRLTPNLSKRPTGMTSCASRTSTWAGL